MIPKMAELTIVSLFTGTMGLDLGFEKRGFEVRVALDNDTAVGATIRANHRTIPVVTRIFPMLRLLPCLNQQASRSVM